ncbi:KCTD8_12_16 [Mytilus edulis]|uniref:KCTD8_12_16 n=1 Tax=Mytilus edulis TaxID=6550 RepID=A0A8S3RIV4_MYTED|nr:KCTD8_12_16 [Mytilus edulis]
MLEDPITQQLLVHGENIPKVCWLGYLVIPEKNVIKDKNGHYFVDRSGKYFEYILDYLRDEQCLPPVKVLNQLQFLVEARFYGLHSLVTKLETKYDFSANFPNVTPTYHALRESISKFGLQSALYIISRDTSNQKWNALSGYSSGYSYFHTGHIDVRCKDSKEAHLLINCLWKDLIRKGFDANMNVHEFQNYIICKFDLKPEMYFNA